jgi:hypothetical protein
MVSSRLLVVALGMVAAAWSVARWRQAVKLTMVLLILEGALRKWVVPGSQDLVYFAKDVFLLGAYLGFLQRRSVHRYRPPHNPVLYIALSLAALVGVVQILNPSLPNILVGVFGFKAYFFYVPLLFVVPAAFNSDAELFQAMRRYVLVAIPVCLLAVAQFFSPATSMINSYAWGGGGGDVNYVATFGSSTYVRVTGTFSFITGFTSYLLANAILLLTLLGQARWRMRGNLLLYASLGLTLLGMLMTGSRGPVYAMAILFPFYWWLGVAREGDSGATFGRLVLGIGLLALFLGIAGEQAFSAFYGRAIGSSSDVGSRITYPLTVPFEILPIVGFLGYGIGATHQTAAALTVGIPPYSWLHGLLVEPETGRIMVEMGGVGFLLIYLIRIFMPFWALLQIHRLRSRFHRSVATASFLYFLSQVLGTVVFDVTSGVFYWFFGGLLMTVLKLDQQSRAAAARNAAAAKAEAPAPVRTPAPAGAGSAWQRRTGSRSW